MAPIVASLKNQCHILYGGVLSKKRASKGLLLPPIPTDNVSQEKRSAWLTSAEKAFVQPTPANKKIYKLLLEKFWPLGHGIPGPVVSETEVRYVIDNAREALGKQPYKDPFRRLRELQGDEGFTCIIKEGKKYQLQHLEIAPKRPPRENINREAWNALKEKAGRKCSVCGLKEPDIKLSPDHRQPRSRGGTNEESNLQPLCEQCNNLKSSACSGCNQNCFTCPWAFPEHNKPIFISGENRELLRRAADKRGINPSELTDLILRDHFIKHPVTP